MTWEEHAIDGTASFAPPYIAAVSPSDPNVVYLRTDRWDDEQQFAAQDSLIVTTDGGETFREILHRQAKLFGFALSPDGSTVLAGYGDPVVAGRMTNFDDFGIYKASAADYAFDRISDKAVSCLRWTRTGVYACITDLPYAPSPDLALGFAPNADFTLSDPNPLVALLDTKQVKGPLACTGDICEETWSMGLEGSVSVCQALSAPCEGDFSTNALSCPMDPGGTGGSGGAGGESGAGTSGGSGGSGTTTGGTTAGGATGGGASGSGAANGGAGGNGTSGTASGGKAESSDDEGGCGCRHPSGGGSRAVPWMALAAALAALRARTRRRRTR
jgi:MYXO-CTERM domain-containing protein